MADEAEHPRAVLTEALELARAVQDPVTIARSLFYLGVLGQVTKDWDQGRRHVEEALASWQDAGDAWGIAYTLLYLGVIEFRQGHYQKAMPLMEDGLARCREIGDLSARGLGLFFLVFATGEQADASRAMEYAQELRDLSSQSEDRRLLLLCGEAVTWLLRDEGDPEQLTRLLGGIQQLREMMGIYRGRTAYTSVVLSLTTEAVQPRIGQEAFEAALAEGRSLTFQEMRALIRELLDGAAQGGASEKAAQKPRDPGLLSPREQDVLRLVAEGRSNKEIAKELIIAESTAKYYVTGVFNKLGVDSRAQAVAVAAQRGLL
jgi:non-specific serine/threonine protein kinase